MKEVSMNYRLKVFIGLICMALLVGLSLNTPLFAKSTSVPSDRHERQRYIVLLEDPPLATHDRRRIQAVERDTGSVQSRATANKHIRARKLNVNSAESKKHLQFLDERFKTFRGKALLRLGRQLKTVHRYRHAINGFATELTATELKALREVPGVMSIFPDKIYHLEAVVGTTKILTAGNWVCVPQLKCFAMTSWLGSMILSQMTRLQRRLKSTPTAKILKAMARTSLQQRPVTPYPSRITIF
jgi:hypothetical protein